MGRTKFLFSNALVVVRWIFFVSLLLASGWLNGQNDTAWAKIYSGARDDFGYDVIETQDGGFMIVGQTSSFDLDNAQIYMLKIDSAGIPEWSKSFGGPRHEEARSVLQLSDGSYIMVGTTSSTSDGSYDLYLLKTSPTGVFEYEFFYGGSDWDFGYDIEELGSGKFLLAGKTYSYGNGDADGWLMVFDENLQQVVWDTTIGTGNEEFFNSLTVTGDTLAFAAGGGSSPEKDDMDMMVARIRIDIGSDKYQITQVEYIGDSLIEYANDVVHLGNGEVIIAGASSDTNDLEGSLLVRLDTSFHQTWSTLFLAPPLSGIVHSIELAGGDTLSFLSDTRFDNTNRDFYLGSVRVSDGSWLKGTTLGSGEFEQPSSLKHLKRGYIAVGSSNGFTQGPFSVIVYRTDEKFSIQNQDVQIIEDTILITTYHYERNPNILQIFYASNAQQLAVKSTSKSVKEVWLYDLYGRIVGWEKTTHDFISFQPSATGIYIAVVKQNGEINRITFFASCQ
jgi:hypothetical protein